MIDIIVTYLAIIIVFVTGIIINLVIAFDVIRGAIFNENKEFVYKDDKYITYLLDTLWLIVLILGSFITTGVLIKYAEYDDLI